MIVVNMNYTNSTNDTNSLQQDYVETYVNYGQIIYLGIICLLVIFTILACIKRVRR